MKNDNQFDSNYLFSLYRSKLQNIVLMQGGAQNTKMQRMGWGLMRTLIKDNGI